MTDGLGLFDNSRRHDQHDDEYDYDDEPREPRRKKRRSPTFWVVAVVVVAIIAGGAWYGVTQVLGFGGFDDYAGAGDSDVVVEVKAGQGTADIGAALKAKDVVASSRAFTSAGEDQPKVKAIQPGYYLMKTKMSGKAAVDRIVTKDARVGQLQIRAGTQLDDIKQPDGKTTAGIFTLISNAGTVTMNGKKAGPTVEELRKVAENTDLAQLGAPAWAVPFLSLIHILRDRAGRPHHAGCLRRGAWSQRAGPADQGRQGLRDDTGRLGHARVGCEDRVHAVPGADHGFVDRARGHREGL